MGTLTLQQPVFNVHRPCLCYYHITPEITQPEGCGFAPSFSPQQGRYTRPNAAGFVENPRRQFSMDASLGVFTVPIVEKHRLKTLARPRGVVSY